MGDENSTKKTELTLKQKGLIYFYKLRQFIYNDWLITRNDLIEFSDSFLFYLLISFLQFSFRLIFFLQI